MYQGTVVHNTYVEDEQFQATKVIPNVLNSKDRELQSRDIGFLLDGNDHANGFAPSKVDQRQLPDHWFGAGFAFPAVVEHAVERSVERDL